MDKPPSIRFGNLTPTTLPEPAKADSKLGAATFVVFALCLIAIMVMGTIKLGLVLFG